MNLARYSSILLLLRNSSAAFSNSLYDANPIYGDSSSIDISSANFLNLSGSDFIFAEVIFSLLFINSYEDVMIFTLFLPFICAVLGMKLCIEGIFQYSLSVENMYSVSSPMFSGSLSLRLSMKRLNFIASTLLY